MEPEFQNAVSVLSVTHMAWYCIILTLVLIKCGNWDLPGSFHNCHFSSGLKMKTPTQLALDSNPFCMSLYPDVLLSIFLSLMLKRNFGKPLLYYSIVSL